MKLTYTIYELGLMIAFVSFLGFLVENTWLFLTKGYIDNRNMTLPFLFGYGIAILLIYLLLGTPGDLLLFGHWRISASQTGRTALYFLCVMVFVSVGEILLGTLVEKICHMHYWNYSWIPLHITRYTSIPTSLGFATIITLFMNKRFTPLMEIFVEMDPEIVRIAATVLVTAMGLDFVVSFYKMRQNEGENLRWRKEFSRRWIMKRQ